VLDKCRTTRRFVRSGDRRTAATAQAEDEKEALLRKRTQWILIVVGAAIALPGRAAADTWTVRGAFASTVRLQLGSLRPQVVRSHGNFDLTATLAPDGRYEITGPFSLCQPADGFQPRGR
jgi:hypothetical protein